MFSHVRQPSSMFEKSIFRLFEVLVIFRWSNSRISFFHVVLLTNFFTLSVTPKNGRKATKATRQITKFPSQRRLKGFCCVCNHFRWHIKNLWDFETPSGWLCELCQEKRKLFSILSSDWDLDWAKEGKGKGSQRRSRIKIIILVTCLAWGMLSLMCLDFKFFR